MATEDAADLANMTPVIRDIRAMYTPGDDISLVKKVGAHMQEALVRRREEDETMRGELKPLANKLATARQTCQRPNNVPSQAAHAQTVKQLDQKRFALVKAIEEAETVLNDKNAEYARLKADLKELEEKEVADEIELDGVAVRLSLYQDLGFQLVEEKGGEPPKVLIRSQSNDVHIVTLDGTLSDFELRNRLWQLNST